MSDTGNQSTTRFKVIGVGGIGCQVISQIATTRAPTPPNIEYIAMDTDAQDLEMACVPIRIQLGGRLLHGLDSGTDPGMGRRAAEESKVQIRQSVRGAEIVFIIAETE
jgi:cell division protein FtsZ